MIYLDHAATTPVKERVLQAMLPYFSSHFANASSSYSAARESRRAIEQARAQVAALIGAQPHEIYFTSGGSEADNWAIAGVMGTACPSKAHMITTEIEHHAVLRTCSGLESKGYAITYAPVNTQGVVDTAAVRQSVTDETRLISVMLANNEVGTVQPVAELSSIAKQHGIPVHTDAVQAVGHINVDVNELGVDLLSLSAHKFYGPKGIGALYIRKGTRINRLIYGGEQEKGLRAGTENVAAIVGMGEAAAIASESLVHTHKMIGALRDYMIVLIQQRIPEARINGLGAGRLPGHVHMTIDHADSSLLLMQLDMQGIAASSGSACASGVAERSHVLLAMGLHDDTQADLRFTIGEENTREDIEKTIDALVRILQK